MSSSKLMEKVSKILQKRGRKAYELARNEILNEKFEYEPIHDALRYFIEELWHNFQHPALLSLACESVGGNPEKTTSIGAALVLLTGAADIHDDIIDQSVTKGSKPTVFGKFGRDIALLVGDALLLEGFTLLNKTCSNLPKRQAGQIMNLVKKAFLEIGTAEAKETCFRGNCDLAPEEYLDVIKMKAAIIDTSSRIGAILGGGSFEEIQALGEYGRNFGTLVIIREEFIDVFEPDELKNRAENECLPLPILYAYRNLKAKDKIANLLRKKELTEEDALVIVETIASTKGRGNLESKMRFLIEEGKKSLKALKSNVSNTILREMLYATVTDL